MLNDHTQETDASVRPKIKLLERATVADNLADAKRAVLDTF